MPKSKTHTTIVVTKERLEALDACSDGIASITHLLPLTVSTDVEANLKLALELADNRRAHMMWCDVSLMLYRLYKKAGLNVDLFGDWPDGDILAGIDDTPSVAGADAWVVAQWLAAFADFASCRQRH